MKDQPIRIYDALDMRVFEGTIRNTARIDISSFSAGIYLVKLGSDSASSGCFVKQ